MSYKNTILISETTLKDGSFLTDNVDMKNLTPTVKLVQDINLQQTMGTKLYREVQRQVYNSVESTGSIESRISTLLDDFIEPILLHGTTAEAVYDLTYKFGNLTVLKNDGENEKNPTIKELTHLSERHKNRMEFYVKRLDDYLCENEALYPEFKDNVDDDIRPNRQPYTSAIFTGRNYDEYYKDKLPAAVRYKGEN